MVRGMSTVAASAWSTMKIIYLDFPYVKTFEPSKIIFVLILLFLLFYFLTPDFPAFISLTYMHFPDKGHLRLHYVPAQEASPGVSG